MDVLTIPSAPASFTDENLHCLVVGRAGEPQPRARQQRRRRADLRSARRDPGDALRQLRRGLPLRKDGLRPDGEERPAPLQGARLFLLRAHGQLPGRSTSAPASSCSGARSRRPSRPAISSTASYTRNALITLLLATGEPLGEVQRDAEDGIAFARKAKFDLVVDVITTQLRLIRPLRGSTARFSSFDDDDFDEGAFERRLQDHPSLALSTCWYWIRKLQARLLARRPRRRPRGRGEGGDLPVDVAFVPRGRRVPLLRGPRARGAPRRRARRTAPRAPAGARRAPPAAPGLGPELPGELRESRGARRRRARAASR